MKDLRKYLECEGGGGVTPANTLGAGNPAALDGNYLSEPIQQGSMYKEPTAKAKKEKFSTSINKKKKHNMKDLKEQLNENLNEARNNGECVYIKYDRSMEQDIRKAAFFAKDLYEAVYKLATHVGTYIYDDAFEAPDEPYDDLDTQLEDCCYYLPDNAPKKDRDKVAEHVLNCIMESNGDGCDFITLFKWNGKTYIEEEGAFEEEQW